MSQSVNQLETQRNIEGLTVHNSSAETSNIPGHESLGLIADRATEVFGSRQNAMRWLGTPIPALEYETPVSMLDRTEGVNAVLAVLGRIEHGVF